MHELSISITLQALSSYGCSRTYLASRSIRTRELHSCAKASFERGDCNRTAGRFRPLQGGCYSFHSNAFGAADCNRLWRSLALSCAHDRFGLLLMERWPAADVVTPTCMSPRWLNAVRRFLTMKRARRRKPLYADSDDDDGTSTPCEKHTHIDWCHRDDRTSVHTTYHELPASPNKRPRAASMPSSFTMPSLVSLDCSSSLYDTNGNVIEELEYLYQQFQLNEQQSDNTAVRERTPGVSIYTLHLAQI